MTSPGQKNLSSDILREYIESIDALFLKLELAYHYQFYKVFGTDDKLDEGKKLWANSLKKYEVSIINEASEEIIHTQPYFPTLTDIVKLCEQLKKSTSLPSVDEAFIEARKSFSPRKKYNWSHPIIYLAGKKTGWNFLNEKDGRDIFYDFKKNYEHLVKAVNNGKEFSIPEDSVDEELKPLDQKLFESLRKKFNI
ncbi:MAG: hypothetical protein ISR29_05745 [SAR86 cluster bacterium]|uniref:Replicative helicase inhibitor G39P N-terminal domain-containing protein n=1 Tax=SAR86 cluster bacterium TaxID=2030880 RepID=A0A937M2Y1_9GAMM|nr:hypothetical protein [SAR86 cluster bacterium]